MKLRAPLIAVSLMLLAAALLFWIFQRQLSSATFAFGSHPETLASLESSLEDLKHLAELDPENEPRYRARFDRLLTTTNRLRILEHTHEDLVRRYEALMLMIFTFCVIAVTGVYAVRQGRQETRLARLGEALTQLAEGRTDIRIDDHGGDTVGRIASMVEQTSRVMAGDRRRLAALRNLSAWQEAARRHAHEIRTPLTGAKLEVDRVVEALQGERSDGKDELLRAALGAQQEIERLVQFTQQFHRFARLPGPKPVAQDLGQLLEELVSTYESAWPKLRLQLDSIPGVMATVDRDLLRQVMVNLLDNSSEATSGDDGLVKISLHASDEEARIEVTDSGTGVEPAVRDRLFDPYATTRGVGRGVGLGLPISKKIMLDHGGDLELVESTEAGTRFRLSLPRASAQGDPK